VPENKPWHSQERLENLYIEEDLTMAEIGEKLGTSTSTISYWLDKYNISTKRPRRPEGDIEINEDRIPNETPWRDKETLYWLHHQKGIGTTKISNILDCDQTTIKRWIEKYGIERGEPKYKYEYDIDEGQIPDKKPWRDESILRWLYCEEGMGTRQVADVLDCAQSTACNWLRKYDLLEERKILRPSKEKLRDLYCEQELTGPEIAEEIGCESHSTVYRWLDEYDIEIRREQIDYSDASEELRNKELLEELYFEKQLGVDKIAKRIGCSAKSVREWFEKHGIEIYDREEALAGDRNPNWRGGRLPYGPGWTKKKRETVRKRDGFECQGCGMSNQECKEKFGMKLHVHHIIPAREFEDPERRNDIDNLVSLCQICHRKWEGIPLKPSLTH
jgi:transposase-like protein